MGDARMRIWTQKNVDRLAERSPDIPIQFWPVARTSPVSAAAAAPPARMCGGGAAPSHPAAAPGSCPRSDFESKNTAFICKNNPKITLFKPDSRGSISKKDPQSPI